MGMGFAPTWIRQVSPPPLHKTTLTTAVIESLQLNMYQIFFLHKEAISMNNVTGGKFTKFWIQVDLGYKKNLEYCLLTRPTQAYTK